ncbi:hypothetical protein ACUNEI_16870 [Serratia sp. IR-2025]
MKKNEQKPACNDAQNEHPGGYLFSHAYLLLMQHMYCFNNGSAGDTVRLIAF